jgi:hypothetical protein
VPDPQISSVSSWLQRRLAKRKLQFFCVSVLLMTLILLALWARNPDIGTSGWGPQFGADFAGFYVAGRILNLHSPADLYNISVHDRLYHEVLPSAPASRMLTYVHAPFFALLFRPVALLPYRMAYFVWLVISLALYAGGLACFWASRRALPVKDQWTVSLLALSFVPFVFECWLGGQASGFGFLCSAACLYLLHYGNPFAAGLVLSACFYKPTLLLLILPLLLVARHFRILYGVATGAVALIVLSWTAVGTGACLGFIRLLVFYAHAETGDMSMFRNWKYVDLGAFWRLLPFPHPVALGLVPLLIAGFSVAWIGWEWRNYKRRNPSQQRLLWAAALTWTPVLNLYGPVYDTVLAALGCLIAADVVYQYSNKNLYRLPQFVGLLAAVYLTPWFSNFLARTAGLQAFTVVLWIMGAYLLTLIDKIADDYNLVARTNNHLLND